MNLITKAKTKKISLLVILLLAGFYTVKAQKADKPKVSSDSIAKQENNTMMLNATNSTGPREVNIGLPGSVAGTSVNSNGLPTMYFFWPVFPTHVWRLDASTEKFQTYDLFKNAIMTGEVGIAVNTYDNLGTNVFKGSASFNTNSYGLINSTGNVSGPINKKGLLFNAGYYIDYDPGTLDVPFKKYYSDESSLFKAALTQKYNGGKSHVSVMYKFMTRKGMNDSNSPFFYKKDGTIDEIPGIGIGKASFYERSGKAQVKDLFTGNMKEVNLFDNNKVTSNDLYVIGINDFGNNLKLNYNVKLSHVKSRKSYSSLLGSFELADDYTYFNNGGTINSPVKKYGYRQGYDVTPDMTIKTFSSRISLTKKWATNELELGTMVQMYNPGTYYNMKSQFYTDINKNPQIIYIPGNNTFDQSNGYLSSEYNKGTEYYRGKERKYAFYAYDNWDINSKLNLKLGARMEYQTVKGFYAPGFDEEGKPLPQTARNSDGTFSSDKSLYRQVDKEHFNYAFNGEFVYKMLNPFGFVGGLGVTRESPHLEKYGGEYVTNPKQTNTSYAQAGFYLNMPFVELVSKATYIKKNNNLERKMLILDENNVKETINKVLYYDMETIGWTTDFLFTPFHSVDNSLKNFKLHFLFTIQDPKYKNYDVNAEFSNGTVKTINYSDMNITKVSKFLLEIDPSYSFKITRKIDANIWLSGRYYSKQYANLSNSLYYAAHWETFGGFNLKYNNFEFSTKFTNLLNQKGVNGTIGGTDLYTQSDIDNLLANGNRPIYAASYIRPFTAEFGIKYKF